MREQEDRRSKAPELCLLCTLGWAALCQPPVKCRQDRETCSLLNFLKELNPGGIWRAESRMQPSENLNHKILCYGHASSCSSCAGAGGHHILQNLVQGDKPTGKLWRFSSPSPPIIFSCLCAEANFLHKIPLTWRGNGWFPRAVAQDFSHIPTPWYPPYPCTHFRQVPLDSQFPLLPKLQVAPARWCYCSSACPCKGMAGITEG